MLFFHFILLWTTQFNQLQLNHKYFVYKISMNRIGFYKPNNVTVRKLPLVFIWLIRMAGTHLFELLLTWNLIIGPQKKYAIIIDFCINRWLNKKTFFFWAKPRKYVSTYTLSTYFRYIDLIGFKNYNLELELIGMIYLRGI